MSHQSEKIVHLSREIFQNKGASKALHTRPASKRDVHTGDNLRSFCLAAVAKATGHTAITPPSMTESDRPLTRYQAVEIEALIFYTAQQKGMSVDHVKNEALRFLRIVSLSGMTPTDYRRIRDYLWQRLKG